MEASRDVTPRAELVVTAACCTHTGGVRKGHVCCDSGDDNYLAEMAAIMTALSGLHDAQVVKASA